MSNLPTQYDIRQGVEHAANNRYGRNTLKSKIASSLSIDVANMLRFGGYNTKYSKKILKDQLYKDAIRDDLILSQYREYKSSLGLFAVFAWPIFKMILSWVIEYVIDNYLEV